jgi:hypothetical protein
VAPIGCGAKNETTMFVLLLLVGLAITLAGVVTVGFGIPINAFSIGNTLIVAGTTLLAGGLVLVGLAFVVREVSRLSQRLAIMVRAAEPREPALQPAPPVIAVDPAMEAGEAAIANLVAEPHVPELHPLEQPVPEPRIPEPRVPEPRPEPALAVAAAPAAKPRGRFGWLRSKKAAPATLPGQAPTEPADQNQPSATAPAAEVGTPAAWSPDRGENLPAAPPAERNVRGAPPPTRDAGLFDVAWPDPKTAAAEPTRRAPARNVTAARARPAFSPERRGSKPAIHKSGVIDGMAYTLYADGSIEAELPQGTLSFASVDALRAHLDRHGS